MGPMDCYIGRRSIYPLIVVCSSNVEARWKSKPSQECGIAEPRESGSAPDYYLRPPSDEVQYIVKRT